MYDFIVIGAGPAGIAAVGELIDKQQSVAWIDPTFTTGRLQRYRNVPSNTKVDTFREYLTSCESFKEWTDKGPLWDLDPQSTCKLGIVVDELQSLTNYLSRYKCTSIYGTVDHASFIQSKQHWNVVLDTQQSLLAKNIVVAIGAEPKQHGDIPFDVAIDYNRLRWYLKRVDIRKFTRFVVHGDSHSAMLILRNLYQVWQGSADCILNIYKTSDFRFAEYLPNGRIVYDNTGLKGDIAQWVKDVYCQSSPKRLSTAEYTVAANDIQIYAIGFRPTESIEFYCYTPDEDGGFYNEISECDSLYAFGIYKPEIIETDTGTEKNVGLIKFMRHVKKTFADL